MSITVFSAVPNPVDALTGAVGDVVGGAAESAVETLADAVGEGVTKVVASLGTLWVKVGTPNVTSADGTSASPTVAFIQSQLWWYMAAAAILAVIIGGARMAWEQRAEPGRELLKGLMTLVVVSGCGLAAISLAVSASDEFARGVIDASLEDNGFGKNVAMMLGFSSAAGGSALGPLLVIVLGLIAILVSVAQIMLMVVRAGMLVLLAGALPLAASFTSTEAGRAWFRRFTGWLLAWVLYKPAAAIIYATAFRLLDADVFSGDGLLSVLVGLALMVIAVIALPALLKFLVPMTSAVAGAGGGGGGGAMLAAAMPTGAIALGNRMALAPAGGGPGGGLSGSGGSAGPRGTPGPSGATGSPGPSGGDGPPIGGSGGGSAASGSGAAAEPMATPASSGAGGAAGVAGAGPAGAPGQSGASAAGGAAAGGAAAGGPGAAGGASGAAAAGGPAGAAAGAAVSAADGARRKVTSAAEGAAGSSDEDEGGPRGSR